MASPRSQAEKPGPSLGPGKFAGVSRATREIKMPNGTAVHLNAFDATDEPLHAQLRETEMEAREIREKVKLLRTVYIAAARLLA